jgi:hypothetical protein
MPSLHLSGKSDQVLHVLQRLRLSQAEVGQRGLAGVVRQEVKSERELFLGRASFPNGAEPRVNAGEPGEGQIRCRRCGPV